MRRLNVRLTRRRFLWLTALTLAMPGVAWLAWTIPWSPHRRLQGHFPYLDLDRSAVDAYLQDYQRYFGRLPWIEQWPPDVYTRFLLSTDFFRFGADETRTVRYIGFYDPYVTPCSNLLAQFD
jgi:hypothetical protein